MEDSDVSDKTRMTTVWQNFLQSAKAKKRCLACDRGIHDDEAAAIEKYVSRSDCSRSKALTICPTAHGAIHKKCSGRHGGAEGG